MLYNKIIAGFFLCFTLFSFSQCRTTKNDTQDVMKPIIPITTNKTQTISKINSDGTMELVITKLVKRSDPATHFSYKVYITETKRIIKEGNFRGEDIEWNDATSLKLIPYIGMIQKEDTKNENTTTPEAKIIYIHK